MRVFEAYKLTHFVCLWMALEIFAALFLLKFKCKDFACFLETSDNSNNTLHSVTLLKSPKVASLFWKIPVESLFSP